MAFSLLPREDEYFSLFAEMTGKIQDGSKLLAEMLEAGESDLASFAGKIKDVEHDCDDLTHRITTKLNSSFITPFDREDIFGLAVALDDVCDYIDAAARAILMYGIREFNDDVRKIAGLIRELTSEINAAVLLLKKPSGIAPHIVEIHRLENAADDGYFRAIGSLFQSSNDPIFVIKWKELYEILENATDRCESVANIIETIVLKHS
jgi:hypothetical protein